jgi:predicted AlkP superfamily pyrophosphatase or phosphodiesterase
LQSLRLVLIATLALSCTPASVPCATVAAKAAKEPPGPVHHVVVITIDGLLPESYTHPDAHGLAIPALRSIIARGAASDGALSVFPTVTYPSHTSMTTGVNPGTHGIVGNHAFDPLGHDYGGWRWYAEETKRDPVWAIAERAGYHVALVQWPVTVGAHVSWLVPEYWRAKDDNDRKLLRAISTPGLLESVAAAHVDFWPRCAPPDVHDDALADIATFVIERDKPTLTFLHLVGVDGAQHAHGLWSDEARAAIEEADRQVARVMAALERVGMTKDTNVIVASDHGFMNAPSMVEPCVLLRDAGLVTVKGERVVEWKAAMYPSSGSAYVYLQNPNDSATRDAALAIFAEKARAPEKSGVARVYSPSDIATLGGDRDAAFAIEATPGFQFGARCTGDYTAPAEYAAVHGYDPRRPEMRASLLMVGATVPHGAIRDAHLVDIGPTVALWLGLSMPNVDGKALVVTPAP